MIYKQNPENTRHGQKQRLKVKRKEWARGMVSQYLEIVNQENPNTLNTCSCMRPLTSGAAFRLKK